MDPITSSFKEHYAKVFAQHGATSRGVDWGMEEELRFRYHKFQSLFTLDITPPKSAPTVLDVGCGWGGFYKFLLHEKCSVTYTGIDVVPAMIDEATSLFPGADFRCSDIFSMSLAEQFDYVVCNGVLTQKLTASIPAMEDYANRLITRMFRLCRHGICFNHMSTRVNYMVDNLYYRSALEALDFCMQTLAPRVLLDHSFSSVNCPDRGRLFDYLLYVYKDAAGLPQRAS